MGNVDGQVVFITGGGSGIGQAIAETFARRGYYVAITGRRLDKLQQAAQSINQKSNNDPQQQPCWPLQLDVGDAAKVRECIKKVVLRWGKIDVLVNNAGLALGSPKPFYEQSLQDINTVLTTNINGLLYVTHAVLQESMLTNKTDKIGGRGTIVNISSITGLDAPPMGEATYHTSKAAMEGFSNVLRQELTKTNVRVCVVRPGFVGGSTNFHENRLQDDQSQSASDVFQGLEPLLEQDIASAVEYLVHLPERVSIRAIDVVPTGEHDRAAYTAQDTCAFIRLSDPHLVSQQPKEHLSTMTGHGTRGMTSNLDRICLFCRYDSSPPLRPYPIYARKSNFSLLAMRTRGTDLLTADRNWPVVHFSTGAVSRAEFTLIYACPPAPINRLLWYTQERQHYIQAEGEEAYMHMYKDYHFCI